MSELEEAARRDDVSKSNLRRSREIGNCGVVPPSDIFIIFGGVQCLCADNIQPL